jgi:RNA polymerase sigma factor (sigma-70 family)
MIISESKSDLISEANHFQLVFEPQETVNQTMGTSLMNDNSKKLSTWDELLIRVGRDRDKSAFAELFDYFAPRVKSFLLRFGTDMSLAEEIAQEAMIMVWRRAETYDPRQSAASTWIFTIARNKRIDRLRRENRPLPDMTDPAVIPENIETAEIQVARMQQEKKIRHALKNLPEEQAKMIFSAYYEEKSHREISEESGVALGTVKSRIRLALNRLRAHIDEDEGITP